MALQSSSHTSKTATTTATATKTGAPATLSQPSRKGKKAWRKNVDISEITAGLEDLREEIRTTGTTTSTGEDGVVKAVVVAEQSNDQLFVTDTAGDDEEELSKKKMMTVQRKKPSRMLKVDQILGQRSAIPAVDGRKRKSSSGDGVQLGDGIYDASSSKRQREGWVAKKEVQRLRAKINAQSLLAVKEQDGQGGNSDVTDAQFDLWATPAPGPVSEQQQQQKLDEQEKDREKEYIPQPRNKVAPATIHRAPVPLTASGKPAKPVSNPDAGTSYNPSYDAWAALLEREGEKEVAAEQARLAKAKADAERQARIDQIASKRDDTGIDESAWEGFETESDAEGLINKNKKRPTRKTPQQRKKAERRKQQERLAKHEAAMGRKQAQSEQAIMALIKQHQKQSLVQEQPESKGEEEEEEQYTTADAPLRRRRLGPSTIPERQLEVVLPDELQDSLRRLRPEGNLMTDRFRTLLVNGKIEARKNRMSLPRRKRKVKLTEKWSYKDFDSAIKV